VNVQVSSYLVDASKESAYGRDCLSKASVFDWHKRLKKGLRKREFKNRG
jgi:hypothetical protein